jgi:queuosine precursor transporter
MNFKKTENIVFKSDILVGLYVFCIITAELMGSKTFPLFKIFGFNLSGSVGMFLLPWIFSINDIFTEIFGFKRTKNLAKISILIVFLLILLAAFAVSLPPSARYASTNEAYKIIFSQSIRISIASLIAIAISNFADIKIFWKLKQKLKKQGLWLRNNLSNILATLLDTIVFMTLAFYDPNHTFSNNFHFLIGLITPYWLLKVSISIVSTPFVYLGVKWLKSNDKKLQTGH